MTQIEHLRTVTPVWIHPWLWNNAQNLTQYRRGPLLFSKLIDHISRSQGAKIADFDSNWAFPGCQSSLTSLMDFKCCTKGWRSREEVPYCFLGSSIKFQGRTGWKINDSNPLWVRLVGRWQLSNPSDLPCCLWFTISLDCDFISQVTRALIQYKHDNLPVKEISLWK